MCRCCELMQSIVLDRLLQRPTPVAGTGRSGDEARAAHEMRILRMNQPFPGIFNPEEVRHHLQNVIQSLLLRSWPSQILHAPLTIRLILRSAKEHHLIVDFEV